LWCGSFVRLENPLKSFMPEKSVNVNKSSASTSNVPNLCGIFNAHQGVLCVPFDLIVDQGPMGSSVLPPSLRCTAGLVRVDELQNILLTYYHTLANFRLPNAISWLYLYMYLYLSQPLCIFVSVAVAVLHVFSSWWGFVLIKCL